MKLPAMPKITRSKVVVGAVGAVAVVAAAYLLMRMVSEKKKNEAEITGAPSAAVSLAPGACVMTPSFEATVSVPGQVPRVVTLPPQSLTLPPGSVMLAPGGVPAGPSGVVLF